MDPSKRNATALHQRIDEICDNIGNQFTLIVAEAADKPNTDISAAAHTELTIKEQTAALVRSAQDLSSLVRDLQELWLFGKVDTIVDPSDEAATQEKALDLARQIETLAKTVAKGDKPGPPGSEDASNEQGEDGENVEKGDQDQGEDHQGQDQDGGQGKTQDREDGQSAHR